MGFFTIPNGITKLRQCFWRFFTAKNLTSLFFQNFCFALASHEILTFSVNLGFWQSLARIVLVNTLNGIDSIDQYSMTVVVSLVSWLANFIMQEKVVMQKYFLRKWKFRLTQNVWKVATNWSLLKALNVFNRFAHSNYLLKNAEELVLSERAWKHVLATLLFVMVSNFAQVWNPNLQWSLKEIISSIM